MIKEKDSNIQELEERKGNEKSKKKQSTKLKPPEPPRILSQEDKENNPNIANQAKTQVKCHRMPFTNTKKERP